MEIIAAWWCLVISEVGSNPTVIRSYSYGKRHNNHGTAAGIYGLTKAFRRRYVAEVNTDKSPFNELYGYVCDICRRASWGEQVIADTEILLNSWDQYMYRNRLTEVTRDFMAVLNIKHYADSYDYGSVMSSFEGALDNQLDPHFQTISTKYGKQFGLHYQAAYSLLERLRDSVIITPDDFRSYVKGVVTKLYFLILDDETKCGDFIDSMADRVQL